MYTLRSRQLHFLIDIILKNDKEFWFKNICIYIDYTDIA